MPYMHSPPGEGGCQSRAIQLLPCLQAVNEHNAARLPLLLSTKLLPDMDAAAAQMLQAHQAASKDKELAVQVSELTVRPAHLRTTS